jgi:hypothetical protein
MHEKEDNILSSKLKQFCIRYTKRLLSPVARMPLIQAFKREQQWSIGIYAGQSPFNLASPESVNNPILSHQDISDRRASFVADPFMIRVNHLWYMFFEVMNQLARKGEIGLAMSEDGLKWTYQQIILAEPFHLSYPYVFEWMNDYYMIPESYQAGSIRLYKAVNFPTEWSFLRTLLSGSHFADASPFRHDNKWWLFTETNPKLQHDTLRLYYADDLMAPWFEHAQSPLIAGNGHIARPGGRVTVVNDRIIRFAQDCHPIYGARVRAFEVCGLTTKTYHERAMDQNPILTASGTGWNASGMHHVDPHQVDDGRWLACVDGFSWRKR